MLLTAARRSRADEPIEIRIEGDPIAVPPQEPSVAGSVVRREHLRAPGLEAADILRRQPGAAVFETGGFGAPATVSLRGAAAAQTPVYLAGIRLNDDIGGTADLSTVPLWFLNRVEIYRSNAPVSGDQLGLGGAIFFEPRRPSGSEAAVGAMAGSFGARALWARAGVGTSGASALFGLRADGARNDYSYTSDGGTRFDRTHDRRAVFSNADTRRVDAWALGSARLGRRGRAELVLNDVEREQGLQTFALFPTSSARVALGRTLIGLTTRLPCGERNCSISTSSSAAFTHSRYDDPQREAALGTARLDLDGLRFEDAISLRWQPISRLSVAPSLRASLDRLSIAAADSPVAHARRIDSRVALQGEWYATDWLTVRALGGAECHGTRLEGPLPWSESGDHRGAAAAGEVCGQFQTSARAGLELDHQFFKILSTLGHYARVPTLSELYGLSGAVRGNATLLPERGTSWEVGVRSTRALTHALGGLSVEVFGFMRQSSELISYQRSSIGYVRPFNIGAARVLGMELKTAYIPVDFLVFELTGSLLDPRDTSSRRLTNDRLPYQARWSLLPRVEVRSELSRATSCSFGVSYFHESSRFADRAGLIVIPAQGSLDVMAELRLFHEHLSLSVRASNLFDQTRFDLIGYPLPGRAAYLAMEAEW